MKRVELPERGAEALFGNHDENLRFLEDTLKVRIRTQGSELSIEGPPEAQEIVRQIFDQLGALMKDGYSVSAGDVRLAAQLLSQDPNTRLREYLMQSAIRGGKKVVVPRSLNQRSYLEQIEQHDMVFGIGPAGTGKTYLAVAQAVSQPALQGRRAHRPRPPRGRGGREAGLPARGPAGEGRSLPAARCTTRSTTSSTTRRSRGSSSATPSRSRPSPSCAAAP